MPLVEHFLCKYCKSDNVEMMACVNVNAMEYSSDGPNEDQDFWCPNCQENPEIIRVKYFQKGSKVTYNSKNYTIKEVGIKDVDKINYILVNSEETIKVNHKKLQCN